MMDMRRLIPAAGLALALTACGGARTADAPATPAPTPEPAAGFPSEAPAPLPVQDVSFPEYDERTLSNGARLIVVENHEQPVVTIQLLLPGGTAADPTDRPGLASVTASQIDQGTAAMSAPELAEAVDFIGASLGAGASSDWTSVYLTTITEFLDQGLDLMSDVVLNPVFPASELETEKQRRITALKLEKSQPSALAQRAFAEGVYGEHPYGRTATVESIEAIDAAALARFHERTYRPEGALFVVAGAVDPDAIAASLEQAFAGWAGRTALDSAHAPPPTRSDRKMVFVHKPGSVQAVIRIGHLFPSATGADWVTLDAANQVLGSGSAQFTAWMMKVLREEKGFTYGAYSSMSERQGPGYFVMTGEYRNEVADSALMIMLDLAERLREGDIPEADLENAKRYLTGSFPLGIETPQDVASQVAQNRILGRPDRYLTEYRGRVAAVDVQDVAAAAREHIHPDRMLVVVVGDAFKVLDSLRPFADRIAVVDAEGETVDVAALAAAARAAAEAAATVRYDASGLRPREMLYGIMFQGNEVGTMVTRWSQDGDTFSVVTEQRMPGMTISQTTEFDAHTFAPLRTTTSAGAMGDFEVEIRDGRAVGTGLDLQRGPQEVDVEVAPGTTLEGQFDIALAVTDFEDADEMTLQVLTGAGAIESMSATATGEETVEVPAGTFETWRLELGGPQPMTVWVTKTEPHIVVRRELTGQPVSIVLKSM